MNDDELITAVRAQRDKVPMTVPVEQIISRGRSVRARRRIAGIGGALTVAAGAALAVTALVASGHPASPQPTARLAAWTVTRQADGSVSVTFRELRDPAGLQRTLRADGVPASVTFFGQQSPACRPYPYHPGMNPSEARRQTIIMGTPGGGSSSSVVVRPLPPPRSGLSIRPSALPSGVGLQIGAGPIRPHSLRIWAGLVQVSQHCTGS